MALGSLSGMSALAKTVLVFLGGGTGACLRYWTGFLLTRSYPSEFPWPTLLINVLGSLAIGAVLARNPRETVYLLAAAGLLGGFTTFSTFSYEAVTLLRRGETASALLYMGLSVGLCVLGAGLGLWLFGTGKTPA